MELWNIEKMIKKGDYDYALVKNHPNATKNGYVLYHRIIMENHIGRMLTEEEVVHHLDGNKHNNDINNLEIMDRVEHSTMHVVEYFSENVKIIELECAYCHKIFERQKHQYKPNNKHQFCSRTCNGKFYSGITNNLRTKKDYRK